MDKNGEWVPTTSVEIKIYLGYRARQHFLQILWYKNKSDQLLSSYNLYRKCVRWWKTLFFHMIDIAVVNACLLFKASVQRFPDTTALQRLKRFSLFEFREELTGNSANLEKYTDPPLSEKGSHKDLTIFDTDHRIKFPNTKRNCKICYDKTKKELKVLSYCSAPQRMVYLHCTQSNNCFDIWHAKDLNSNQIISFYTYRQISNSHKGPDKKFQMA